MVVRLSQLQDQGKMNDEHAVPETILFVESLDKTSVGKLDKKALRQKYRTLLGAKPRKDRG